MYKQQSIEGFSLQTEIVKRGYAEFDHGISPETIDGLIDAYADFTLAHPDPEPATMDAMLPPTSDSLHKELDELNRAADAQSTWHKYRTNVPGVGKPDGYTNRSFQVTALKRARGIDLGEDPKEFYHHTPVHLANMTRIHEELGWGKIPSEVHRLDTAFALIHAKAAALMTSICGTIEESHPEVGELITPESLRTSPIRLLFYHPSTGEQLGAGHYDKSFGTLQIAESHKGLRLAPSDSSPLEPVVRSADKAVFFAGKSLPEQVQDPTVYVPGWHDIVRSNELNEGRNISPKAQEICARWAIIFFSNVRGFVNPDKDSTHNR